MCQFNKCKKRLEKLDKHFLLKIGYQHRSTDTHKNRRKRKSKCTHTQAQTHNFCQHSDSCKTVATTDTEGSTNNMMPYKNVSEGQRAAHALKQTHKQKAASSHWLQFQASELILFLLAQKPVLLNYADHMRHARPLWLEEAMLLAKWYTGTRETRGKHRNEVSRREGWSKWNMTTSSYQQLHYCSMTTFYILTQE